MTMIAIESLVFLIAGAVLVGVLAWALGWGRLGRGAPHAPSVKLVRAARDAQGREELLLTVNDRVILAASNEGLRLADYAERVEQIEAVATRLAAARGAPVEFARSAGGARKPDGDAGISIVDVPSLTDEEVEQVEARRRAASSAGRNSS
jgi:hypothetical protein